MLGNNSCCCISWSGGSASLIQATISSAYSIQTMVQGHLISRGLLIGLVLPNAQAQRPPEQRRWSTNRRYKIWTLEPTAPTAVRWSALDRLAHISPMQNLL